MSMFRMSNIGSLISSPLIQLLLGGGQIRQQNRLQDQYTADVDQQIADAMRVAGAVGPETLRTYDSSSQRSLQELLGLRPRQMAGANQIISGFEDRYKRGLKNLKDAGKQEARDIEREFMAQAENASAYRQERGINSTTAANSAGAVNSREKTDALGRLKERLRQERAALDAGLSGDVLGARQYGLGLDAANTGNIANWFSGDAANRSNIVGRGFDTYLNTIMGINRVPPPPANVGQFGANMVDPVDYSKGQSSSAPWIGAAGSAAGILAATIFIGVCIGEDSMIDCEDGPKSLRDIKVGDVVINADGDLRKVIAKHFMPHKGDWLFSYRKLTFGDSSIVASRDHVVEGQTVQAWMNSRDYAGCVTPPGPRMMVGDILLSDSSDYVANGLRVASLISINDVDALRVMEPENNGVEVEAY